MAIAKHLEDARLVELLKEGRRSAFEEIYRRYWWQLYTLAYRQTGVKEEAEELVQDVFLALWSRREEVTIRHLVLYLTVAVKNQSYDYIKSQISFRKYQEYLIFQEIGYQRVTDDIVNFTDLTQAIEDALTHLPEKSAEIFKRSRFENQSVREIAGIFNLTEKAVEYHITKSLRFLKSSLKHYHTNN